MIFRHEVIVVVVFLHFTFTLNMLKLKIDFYYNVMHFCYFV